MKNDTNEKAEIKDAVKADETPEKVADATAVSDKPANKADADRAKADEKTKKADTRVDDDDTGTMEETATHAVETDVYRTPLKFADVKEILRACFVLLMLGGILAVWQISDPLIRWSAIGGIFLLYLLMVPLALILNLRKTRRRGVVHPKGPILPDVVFDYISDSDQPVIVCSNERHVQWYNHGALALAPDVESGRRRKTYWGRDLYDMLGIERGNSSVDKEARQRILKLFGERHVDSTEITIRDETYVVSCMDIPVEYMERDKKKNKSKMQKISAVFTLLSFRNITDMVEMEKKMRDDDIAIAYVVIDNVEELMKFEEDTYRDESNQISVLLHDWVVGHNGVIREYGRDKYFCMFHRADVEQIDFVDILDRVREKSAQQIPLTISIGVAAGSGSLNEKEETAQGCLDTALKRGGDQAVVKGLSERTAFYGGFTKSQQKNSGVRVRIVGKELVEAMRSADNVLVMGHSAPDYDAIGAAVGVARLAISGGKENAVHIVSNMTDPNLASCRSLFHADSIFHPNSGKKIFISAEDAREFITPDTLLVIVDVNAQRAFEAPELLSQIHNVAIIDHHRYVENETMFNSNNVRIHYVEPSASSACEIIAEMLSYVLPDGELRSDEATIMLSGITLDTQQFVKSVGTKTYVAASYLRECGADPENVKMLFLDSEEDVLKERMFNSDVRRTKKGDIIITACAEEGKPSDRLYAAKAANRFLNIRGVRAAFALIRIGDAIHISARSNGEINVQLIVEKFGGGGHFDAAGAQIHTTDMKDAVNQLLTVVEAATADKNDSKR